MSMKARCSTVGEQAALFFHLTLTLLFHIGTNTYVNLPFRKPIYNITDSTAAEDAEQESNVKDLVEVWSQTPFFKVLFYLGLALGSITGGTTAYLTLPAKARVIYCKLSVLVSFLAALTTMLPSMSSCEIWNTFMWAMLCFFTLASFVCTYVDAAESMPGTWLVCASLGGATLVWSGASLYSLVLVKFLSTWHARFFWNGFALFCIITLQELVPLKFDEEYDKKKIVHETITDLVRNPLGVRYFLCLLLMWMLHGFICYGLLHELYADSTFRAPIFKSMAAVGFRLMCMMLLCQWTRQKRAVFSVLLILNSVVLFCFALASSYTNTIAGGTLKSSLMQVSSFIISGSFNILWILTVETFGTGVRSIATGICCCSARLTSMLAALLVDADLFLSYPAVISGFLSLVCGLVLTFLLPEPNPFQLVEATKTDKSAKMRKCCIA